jgi:type II secretory pathway pseudopilin PulG
MPPSHRRRAFTLRELWVGLATLTIAAAILFVTTTGARKRAQLAAAQNQLRWIAGITASYAADFEDRMWGLSWQAGELPHSDPTLPATAPTSLTATRVQAIDILRRRGRPDMEVPPGWYAPSLYSHLPLLDYLDRSAPDLSFVSPGDKHRLNWTKKPEELHDQGFWQPFQEPYGGSGPVPPEHKRWPYSASLQVPPAMISEPVSGQHAIRSGQTHRMYVISPFDLILKPVAMTSVAYPSQKVLLHESASWYTGTEVRLFAHRSASVNVLVADGSARILATSESNSGWNPQAPTWHVPTYFDYVPSPWEGPSPDPSEVIHAGHYRFTRGGPAGRDFGGPEIDTGQP